MTFTFMLLFNDFLADFEYSLEVIDKYLVYCTISLQWKQMTDSTGHAMLQLWYHYRYNLGSYLGQLVLPHASRAKADSRAVRAYPFRVLLGQLQRYIVVILQAEAAELF